MKKVLLSAVILISIYLLSAKPITLEESIALAREQNKEILSEKAAVSSAKWQSRSSLASLFPQASFNSAIVRIDDDTYEEAKEPISIPQFDVEFPTLFPIYRTTYTNSFTVQQAIFNGGKVILGYQLSRLARQQAEQVLADKENDISYRVASTYFNILKLYDLKLLTQKSLTSTKSHLQSVQKNFEVGTAKESDVLQWKVKLQNDQTALNEVNNNIKILASMWANLLDSSDLEPEKIEVAEYDPEVSQYAEQNDDEAALLDFLKRVENNNPTIQTLDISHNMMKKNYLMAKGNFLPSLNLQFNYELESDNEFDFDGDENWNLAAIISLPLFTSGKNFSSMKQAQYELKQISLATQSARNDILVGAENTFYQLTTKAQTVLNNKTSLEFARENHKIINNLYEQGMVTNAELLDAEAMLFGSEMNLIASYYDFIILKYEMKRFTGK